MAMQYHSQVLWRLIVAFLLNLLLPFCLPATAADSARILIINAWDDTMPAAVRATTAIRNRLAESSLKNAEIYYDTLDLSRFPGGTHEERMARLLDALERLFQMVGVRSCGPTRKINPPIARTLSIFFKFISPPPCL